MTSAPFAGRTALVTGGGVGIGLAIAQDLARHGARVAISYRSHGPSEEVLAELSGSAPLAVMVDVTDP